MSGFAVHEVHEPIDVDEVRRLVLAHAAIRATTPGVEYMRADALALPGPYRPPRGGLWLARAADATNDGVGCVALRPLDQSSAEVKRMFVDPAWRGRGVGRALMRTLIAAARDRGCQMLYLGTLEDMVAAHSLYRSLGFMPVDRYRPDELVDTRFYALPLG